MFRILSVPILVFLLLWSADAGAVQSELKVWVVEASTENRDTPHLDPGLEGIAVALRSLPHDTFHRLSAGTHNLAAEKKTRVPLVDNYTLEASSPEPGNDGRYRTYLRILIKTKDTPPREIEALSTELLLRPGKHVVVRGLKKEKGKELLLVLSLSVPDSAAP
jgi:hypothetical protein